MTKKLVLAFFAVIALQMQALAQSDEQEVEAVIRSLFEGMKAKDTTAIAQVFAPTAIMQTIKVGAEGPEVAGNPVSDFLKGIGGMPATAVLDERILDYQIKIDGELASVWTPYLFYFNENFSHCGVNSFQLVRFAEGWKIVYIIDTRRKEPCEK